MSEEGRQEEHQKNNSSGTTGKNENDVCRDFLNNICNRGEKCRFYHPPNEEGKSAQSGDNYNFCIDFQNKGCFRANCRFIHANNDDVLRYKKTGDVTISLARAIAALTRSDTINGIPICKEFQHGLCQRGQNGCRYWHINVEEERMNRFGGGDDGYGRSQQRMPLRGGGHGDYDEYDDYYPPPPASKRAHMGGGGGGYGMQPIMPHDAHYVAELERHNSELNTELNALKRELQREKERYDDLLLLLRNSSQQGLAGASAATAVDRIPQPVAAPLTNWPPQPPSMQDKYSWN